MRSRDVRVLVVDDEEPARRRLIEGLDADPDVAAVLQAGDGREAVRLIREERPDLVFLDVQMPELGGMGVIDELGAENMPLTIFVTAYDQHAVRAFETDALDYLLKPYSDERLEAAIARAKTRLAERRAREPAPRPLERLAVKVRGTTHLIKIKDVDWIEADGVYVRLHVGKKQVLHRAALAELAERLDPASFVRVHRSAVVNVDSIIELVPATHGEFDIVLRNGSRPRVSRTYRADLEKRLGQPL